MSEQSTATSTRWWHLAFPLVVCVGFLLIGLALVPIPHLYFYDDGVYYQSGVRVAEGDRPYTDFYLAHPPGLIWLVAIAHTIGMDIVGCRLVSWGLGVVFLCAFIRFVRRVAGPAQWFSGAGLLAGVFLVSCRMFLEAESQVLTQLPGMAFTLAGFYFLLPHNLRPVLAGVLLAAATAFRIQVALIGPAWIVFLFATYGWSAGRRSAIYLTVSAVVVAVAFHGPLALIHPNYIDCVIRSHLSRPATPFGIKGELLLSLLREPQVAVGLFAASALAANGRGVVRGVALFTLSEMLITLFGSRFLGEGYFLPCYPYLMACGAMLIGREVERAGTAWPLVAVTAVVAFCSGIPTMRTLSYRWTTQWSFERDLIQRLRATNGRIVLCTPAKIPAFSGKEMMRDYNTPDTTSPITQGFGSWFVAQAERADIIVVTDVALASLSPVECRALASLSKPILFGTPDEKTEFDRRIAETNR